MVYNDTVSKLGILQDCEMKLFGDNGYGQITSNPNRLLNFTSRINRRQDRFIVLAMQADGRWGIDDFNNTTTLPFATTSIVSGQRDYTLNSTMLEIESVAIMKSATDTNYHVIDKVVDVTDINAHEVVENNSSNVGTPYRYDKIGNSLIFDPTFNYSAPAGIKVVFKRGSYYFVSTDTVREPGFPSIFHEYLSLGASLDYAMDNTMPAKVNTLAPRVQAMELAIAKYYSLRNKDERRGMAAYRENNK